MLKEYVNAQWEKDSSTYFVDGEGFWSKVPNAEINAEYLPNEAGASSIEIRVRTGSTNDPIKFVPSYHVFINGEEVPLELITDDPLKPNEPRPEYGGSHIGWLSGNFETENTFLQVVKFTFTDAFSGIDDANFYDPSHQNKYDEGYKAGLAAGGGGGGCTDEELAAVRDEGYNDGFTEGQLAGYNEGKQAQFEADTAAIVLIS
jgi:hypothetical protein